MATVSAAAIRATPRLTTVPRRDSLRQHMKGEGRRATLGRGGAGDGGGGGGGYLHAAGKVEVEAQAIGVHKGALLARSIPENFLRCCAGWARGKRGGGGGATLEDIAGAGGEVPRN